MHCVLRRVSCTSGLKTHAIFSSALDRAHYLRLLQAYYGFYAPLEAILHASALIPAELIPLERVKTPVLVEDLRALGLSDHDIGQLPRCEQLPAVDSPGACMGVMYVLEGATLGGQVLRREINKRLGLDEQSGTAFLDVYGALTGPRWKAFLNHRMKYPEKLPLLMPPPLQRTPHLHVSSTGSRVKRYCYEPTRQRRL